MKKLNKELTLIASQLTGKNGRVVIAVPDRRVVRAQRWRAKCNYIHWKIT